MSDYKYNEQTYKENMKLIEKVQSGSKVSVELIDGVWCEDYLEKGMRVNIVSAVVDSDHDGDIVYRFILEFEDFEEFNKPFESADYFNDKQIACLTAREAGHYPPNHKQTHYYSATHYPLPFKEIETEISDVYGKYLKSGQKDKISYVQWLEKSYINSLQNLIG